MSTKSLRDDVSIKRDIRAWWGDLYKQAYAGHEEGLDPDTMSARLSELEDMFVQRTLLPTVEMPLSELSGKIVLEIGSGSGAHSALFRKHGASVVALDITAERVAASGRKLALVREGWGHACQADGEHLPFKDASFDIVYSNGVLHHSTDTDLCIAEVHRVLKPGGRAVLMLYARHSAIYWLNIVPRALLSGEIFRWPEPEWVGRLTEGKPKFGSVRNPVTRVYSQKELKHLLAAFRIVSLRRNSFQFDNFAVPRLTQLRNALMGLLGRKPHPGGIFVYGVPYYTETALELALGRYLGFGWNIIAEKE